MTGIWPLRMKKSRHKLTPGICPDSVGERSGDEPRASSRVVGKWSPSSGIVILSLVVAMIGVAVGQRSPCPKATDIVPCSCSVKNKGWDVVCENTDSDHIKKALNVMKSRPALIYYMKFRSNNLPRIQDFSFMNLEVQHLTVISSQVAVVENASLSSLAKSLTTLDLTQNKLHHIPSGALTKLHELTFLNLNRNEITEIYANAFVGLEKLERLSLYSNRIAKIDNNAFKGLHRKLSRLNLGNNKLTRIPTNALQSLTNLFKLELHENQITHVEEGDFIGLGRLDSLILIQNQLKTLPANAFRELNHLNSLEIDQNLINHIDEEAFTGLEVNLEWLKLGGNKLGAIPTQSLKRIHNLRQLDLSANNITILPEDGFEGFGETLKFLSLQKNHITTIPVQAFEALHALEWLKLFSNNLRHLPKDTMDPVLDTIQVLDVHDNPLICDCDLIWLKYWLEKMKKLEEDKQLLRQTYCWMPSNRREYLVKNMDAGKMHCKALQDARVNNIQTSGSQRIPATDLLSAILSFALVFVSPFYRLSMQ